MSIAIVVLFFSWSPSHLLHSLELLLNYLLCRHPVHQHKRPSFNFSIICKPLLSYPKWSSVAPLLSLWSTRLPLVGRHLFFLPMSRARIKSTFEWNSFSGWHNWFCCPNSNSPQWSIHGHCHWYFHYLGDLSYLCWYLTLHLRNMVRKSEGFHGRILGYRCLSHSSYGLLSTVYDWICNRRKGRDELYCRACARRILWHLYLRWQLENSTATHRYFSIETRDTFCATLVEDLKGEIAWFFLVKIFVNISTGLCVGALLSSPWQLIVVRVLHVLYVVLLFFYVPYAEVMVQRATVTKVVFKIIIFCLYGGLQLDTSSITETQTSALSWTIVSMNFLIVFVLLTRQVFLFSSGPRFFK